MKKLIAFTLLAAVLTGCNKKEVVLETKAESKPETDIVTLTPGHLANLELKLEEARSGKLDMTLKAAGRISANLNKTAKVTTTLEGRLTKLNFDLNDRVKAGEITAMVESPELIGKQLEIKAPIDGMIIERTATPGELVDRTKPIYTISDPAQLWVIAEIKERDIAAIKPGQDVSFKVLAYPTEIFHGKVVLIGNQVEAGPRTLEVRIETDNLDGRLKAGMFADVEVITTVLENVLLIPDTALQTQGEEQIVFVALEGNRFQKRVVKLGLEQGGRVEVLEGVKTGEKVVTTGSFIIKSELLKSEMEAD